MHNDEPSLVDHLNREALVKEVGDAIAGCTPPQVFGVHGDWGLGKTSILHQIQWYLTGDCPQQPPEALRAAADGEVLGAVHKSAVRAIWFDAWRYQSEDAPVVALLQEMRMQLSWTRRAARSVSRYASVGTRGALIILDELTKKIGSDKYSKLRQEDRDWEARTLSTELPSYTLRKHLCEAIDQLLPRRRTGFPRPRLVVFVDDLDRCEPEAAYRLLEGMKIYLNLENCVFVLGMNQKAIEDAISTRLDTTVGVNAPQRASSYLEKLCQNVWRLPTIRRPGVVLYRLLEQTVVSQEVRGWIKHAVDVDESHCLPPNPRRLKGLANLLGRLSALIPTPTSTEVDPVLEARLLVVVAYVYQFHQDLYVRWEADSDLYRKIYEWCTGDGDPELRFLSSMRLPQRGVSSSGDQRTPTKIESAEQVVESAFPDPTEASVFWIQPLVRHIGSDIDPQRFERYLHGVST